MRRYLQVSRQRASVITWWSNLCFASETILGASRENDHYARRAAWSNRQANLCSASFHHVCSDSPEFLPSNEARPSTIQCQSSAGKRQGKGPDPDLLLHCLGDARCWSV